MRKPVKPIVIVGAGMAGLTAAAYLSSKNHKVILIEKNEKCGGLVGSIERKGFHFDTGPRALVNSGMVRPIFKDLGIDLKYFENKICISIEDELFRVESMESLKEYKRILKSLYPDDVRDIDRIIEDIYKTSMDTKVLYQIDNPNITGLFRSLYLNIKGFIPWFTNFLISVGRMNKMNEPMESFLKNKTDNQSIINILTQFFFKETPAFFAMGYFYVYMDYFYPEGGTGSIATLLENKINMCGGDILRNKEIHKINPAESFVSDAQGNRYEYDQLIWAADTKTLYSRLETEGLSSRKMKKIDSEKKQIFEGRGGESVFVLFLAVDRPPSYFEKNGGAHLFFTPVRQGLGEINRSELRSIVDSFDSKSKEEIFEWVDRFCDFNTYEVSIPVLRDSSLAPDGQTGIMISVLFDFDFTEKAEKAGWLKEMKEHMENRIIGLFSRSRYKGLNEDVLFQFSSTPLTIRNVAGSSEGAIVGWSFEKPIPAKIELFQLPDSVKTPIPRILQCGQWAFSPSGVPLAMMTGWYASRKIQ